MVDPNISKKSKEEQQQNEKKFKEMEEQLKENQKLI